MAVASLREFKSFQNQRNLGMPKPFQGVHPFLTQTLCPLNSYHQTADSTQQFLKEVFNFSSRYSNFIIFDCKIWQFHFWKGRGHCWSLNISNKPPLLWVYELLKVAKGFPIAIWKGCVQCSGLNKSANIFKTFFSCSAGLVVDPLIVTYNIIRL